MKSRRPSFAKESLINKIAIKIQNKYIAEKGFYRLRG